MARFRGLDYSASTGMSPSPISAKRWGGGMPPVRGSQFRSHACVREVRAAGLHGSMGRVGACTDNAAMESDHRRRRQKALGRLTPIEYETLIQTAHAV